MAGHTNENAYKLIRDVRIGLNEYSAALWAGTDTSGKFDNTYIINKLNLAQARMHALVMKSDAKEIFYTSASVTVTSSVITLPHDFGRILQLEDEDGYKVFPSSARITPVSGREGSDMLYYRKGNTFVLNKSGVSNTYTIKYYKQPRKMTYGAAGAGSGLNSLILAATDLSSGRNDYYNDLTIDNYTQGLYATISDYVGSTRVATTDNTITWATSDVYGTIPDLPQELHVLVAPLAVILIKSEHPAAQERPGAAETKMWAEMFMEAIVGLSNQPEDISLEAIFCDFGSSIGIGYGYNVPGHGNIIY